MMSGKARSYRLEVLPDKLSGQISKDRYNPLLRAGWYKVSVSDRACEILDSLYSTSDEDLERAKSIAHLVGTLHPTKAEDLLEAGFPEEIVLGVRIVQGEVFDTPHSYYAGLISGFDWMKIAKGTLQFAEEESLRGKPHDDIRRRKVFGHREDVRRLLMTCTSREANRLLILLYEIPN